MIEIVLHNGVICYRQDGGNPKPVDPSLKLNQNHVGLTLFDNEFRIEAKNLVFAHIQGVSYRYNKKDSDQMKKNDQKLSTTNYGFAPFNFVPLNATLLTHNSHNQFDIYDEKLLSGYITMNIKSLTNVFIGGELIEDYGYDSFRVGGRLVIPGSSIRGMIRTLVEFISFGRFDRIGKNKAYRAKGIMHSSLGFMTFNSEKKSFDVYPAQDQDGVPFNGGSEFTARVESGTVYINTGNMSGKRNKKYKYRAGKTPITVPDEVKKYYLNDSRREAKKDMKNIFEWATSNAVSKAFKLGVPVFYALNNGRIHSIGHSRSHRAPYNYLEGIPNYLLNPASSDISDSIFGKFSEMAKSDQNFISAGKVYFENAVASDEPGQEWEMLEILSNPYSTADKLYKDKSEYSQEFTITKGNLPRGYKMYWHRKTEIDSPDRIFKTDKNEHVNLSWRKRLFRKKNELDLLFSQNEIRQLIAGKLIKEIEVDKQFELVLEKLDDLENRWGDQLIKRLHEEHKKENSKLQFKLVNAIKPGAKFKGRIRFDNLTEAELGVLLHAVQLTEDCAHKIGMGKPLGLGSIEIESELNIIKRKKRYESVFNKKTNRWCEGDEGKKDEKYIADVKGKFDQKLLSKLAKSDLQNIWQLNRLKELSAILDKSKLNLSKKDNLDWLKKTRYQTLDEYRKRGIMPTPTEFTANTSYYT